MEEAESVLGRINLVLLMCVSREGHLKPFVLFGG